MNQQQEYSRMNQQHDSEKETFEGCVKRLEEIIAELERGDLPLEHSLARYEEGIGRLKRCYGILESVEKKIALLSKRENGSIGEEPFYPEQSKTTRR